MIVPMSSEKNAWVVIEQDERGKAMPRLTGEAGFHLASLTPEQVYAIDAAMHVSILALSSHIGHSVERGAGITKEVSEKIAYRDGTMYARKKLKEAWEAARKATRDSTE